MYRPYLSDGFREIPERFLDAAQAEKDATGDDFDVTERATGLYEQAREVDRDDFEEPE